jgi:hypothetical protein
LGGVENIEELDDEGHPWDGLLIDDDDDEDVTASMRGTLDCLLATICLG